MKSRNTEYPAKISGLIHYYNEVNSTNDTVKHLTVEGFPEGTTVVAIVQTKGRGQKGRSWYSLEGAGLYFSMVIMPKTEPKDLASYVRKVAEIVTSTLRAKYGVEVAIEWPNDLILDSKKVGGILLEAVTRGKKTSFLIIGLGLNLNHDRFPPELRHSAISLFQKTGQRYEIEDVAKNIQEALYNEFCTRH